MDVYAKGVFHVVTAPDNPIEIDNEGRLRLVDPEKFELTQNLSKEAETFVQDVDKFSSEIGKVIHSMSEYAQTIEKQKMHAIGMRMLANTEIANRERRAAELRVSIFELTKDVNRLKEELESLTKLEEDQKNTINRIMNGDLEGML